MYKFVNGRWLAAVKRGSETFYIKLTPPQLRKKRIKRIIKEKKRVKGNFFFYPKNK